MKTIGIVGGMSWESSAEYYRLINQKVKVKLGATHSAELVMYSLDFHPVAQLELEERWAELATILITAITRLEKAGAEFVNYGVKYNPQSCRRSATIDPHSVAAHRGCYRRRGQPGGDLNCWPISVLAQRFAT